MTFGELYDVLTFPAKDANTGEELDWKWLREKENQQKEVKSLSMNNQFDFLVEFYEDEDD